MTPSDLDMFQVKNTNMHVTDTPEAKFSPVSLYDEPFLSYSPIFRKVHRMTPKDHDMFQVKKHEIFELPIGYNVKIKSLITLNELKISKF